MTYRLILLVFVSIVAGVCPSATAAEKPRVLVLTDIENEPDDAMSMVRFLTYTNQEASPQPGERSKGQTSISTCRISKGSAGAGMPWTMPTGLRHAASPWTVFATTVCP